MNQTCLWLFSWLSYMIFIAVPSTAKGNDVSIQKKVDEKISRISSKKCEFLEYEDDSNGRSAISNPDRWWPNGIVPYQFYTGPDMKYVYSINEKRIIYKAFRSISQNTKVKFVPKNLEHKDFVTIKMDHPRSRTGRGGGEQFAYYNFKDCINEKTVLHETMHVLGFFHEMGRPDRDRFIKVNFGNIKSGLEINFMAVPNSLTLGQPYDYESIMQYEGKAGSKNGGLTIQTLDPKYQQIIGKAEHLSKLDIDKILKLYP